MKKVNLECYWHEEEIACFKCPCGNTDLILRVDEICKCDDCGKPYKLEILIVVHELDNEPENPPKNREAIVGADQLRQDRFARDGTRE